MAGKGTQEVDVGGKVIVPGFIDSHVHFISGGLQVNLILISFLRKSYLYSLESESSCWMIRDCFMTSVLDYAGGASGR